MSDMKTTYPSMKKIHLVIASSYALLTATVGLVAQQEPAPPIDDEQRWESRGEVKLTSLPVRRETLVYKHTPQGDLEIHLFLPQGEPPRPAGFPGIVFFFGGGLRKGKPEQFFPQAEYLATRGMVAASAAYRVLNQHHTMPEKAVEDAKSAVRWLRAHAKDYRMDPDRFVSAGGSAGGRLAAATALVKAYDAESDDLRISAKPNALVLFNPSLWTSKLYLSRNVPSEIAELINPNRFIDAQTPPAVVFYGSLDSLKEGGDEYVRKARALSLRAEMWTAPGYPHGFFNLEPWIQVTTRKMDEFLVSIGYLEGPPTLELSSGLPVLVPE